MVSGLAPHGTLPDERTNLEYAVHLFKETAFPVN